jgi:RHH-type proline utilization regulon transcriptional repressor/proline dehydrogenase/delta 1-pyrroline-5-carboxylate dehydrogenase
MGIPLRVYTPFGEPTPGMAYLVRRILENSSNESFLKRSFVEDAPMDELLASPEEALKKNVSSPSEPDDDRASLKRVAFRYRVVNCGPVLR